MKRRRASGKFAAEGSNAGCSSLSFWESLLLVYSCFDKTALGGYEVPVMKCLRFDRAGLSVHSLCTSTCSAV